MDRASRLSGLLRAGPSPGAACAGILVAASMLAGCAEPFQATLTFAVPDKFEAARSTEPPKISRWWTRFGSSELNGIMDGAYVDNLDIATARATLEQAEAQAQIAAAALWPTFNYNDDAQRTRSSGTNNPGVINPASTRNNFSKVIAGSWVVDLWGLNRKLLEAALLNADASAYQVEVVRLATRASVVNNFLILTASRERIAVANRNVANAERVLKTFRERFEAGTASALDVAQQQSLLEAQRATVPVLRQAAETARTAIALLSGKPANEISISADNVRRLKIPKVTPGLPSSLLVRRPDVRSAEARLAGADANVEAARRAFLPNIQLTGQVGFQSALLSTLLRKESFIYTIASSVTQTIFDGGRLRGQLRLSEAQRQELLGTYRKTILQALIDVENALIAIREGAAREAAQQRAVEAARRALTLSQERLEQGAIDITTLLTVQTTLFQVEDALLQARLARLQAITNLFLALGGDWDDEVLAGIPYR